jgi:rhodanese-related sulfurtransferase
MPKSLSDFTAEARNIVDEVAADSVADLVASGWTLIDVREPDEFAEGHIPGALNFPRGFLEVRADFEHPKRDQRLQDRNQRFICYCGGGHRSLLAAKTLKEMGFADAVSLSGGWTGWVENGLPSTKQA